MIKRISILILSLILVFSMSGCGNNAAPTPTDKPGEKKEILIRAGITASPEEPLYKGLLKFKELVEAKANGEIKVETYYIGQLGDDRTMIENLQLGAQEVVLTVPAPISNFVTEYKIFDFPMLFPNAEVADKVLDGKMGQKMLDMLRAQKIVGLSYFDLGFVNMFNNAKAIEKVEDFKGLKFRTVQSDFQIDMFNALGANPTPMQFTEIFTALQQGTVNGFAGTMASFYASKFYEVQQYATDTQHLYAPVVFMIASEFYDGLSSEHQKIVKEAAQEAALYERELNRGEQAKAVAQIEAKGVTVSHLSEEERQKMFDLLQPVIDKYSESVGKELVDEFYAAVDEAK